MYWTEKFVTGWVFVEECVGLFEFLGVWAFYCGVQVGFSGLNL